MTPVQKGIGGVWSAPSQPLLSNGRMDDLFQLIEILENVSIILIVFCNDEYGIWRKSNISSP